MSLFTVDYPRPFEAGDIVMVRYISISVSRYLSEKEARLLNHRISPWKDLSAVWEPQGRTHYYYDCGGKHHPSTSRSIQATTCRHCLLKRARALTGWRWTHPYNASEVSWLRHKLGDRVADFAYRKPSFPPFAHLAHT